MNTAPPHDDGRHGPSTAAAPSRAPVMPVPANARELIGLRDALSAMIPAALLDPSEGPETEAVDRIRFLEQIKAAATAAQARETAALHSHRVRAEAEHGVPAGRRGRGLGAEIGLARRCSPQTGSRHLRMALNLAADLPHTLAALQSGRISEDHAATVERHTQWLDPASRQNVDTHLAELLGRLGTRELAHEAQSEAHHQNPEAAAEHHAQAMATRHVNIKHAEDGMAYLTALLPALDAAACHRALTDQAASAMAFGEAEGRTPQQVLTDFFVDRLTGRTDAAGSPVEVQLIMTDTALFAEGSDPAWIPGHGPLPAATARAMLESADAKVFLRQLYTAPTTGQLVAMASHRREFPRTLRHMILMRDNVCRTPYCTAPIRHIDHATPHRDGGATSYANGSGLCARCNYTKEYPGWTHQATPDQLEVTTPTGHRYSSRPRPLAKPPPQPMAASAAVSHHALGPVDYLRPRLRPGSRVEYARAA